MRGIVPPPPSPKHSVPDNTPVGSALVPVGMLGWGVGGGIPRGSVRLIGQPPNLLGRGLVLFESGVFCVGPELKPVCEQFLGGGRGGR